MNEVARKKNVFIMKHNGVGILTRLVPLNFRFFAISIFLTVCGSASLVYSCLLWPVRWD